MNNLGQLDFARIDYEKERGKAFTAEQYQDICAAENAYFNALKNNSPYHHINAYSAYKNQKKHPIEDGLTDDSSLDNFYLAEIIHKRNIRRIKQIGAHAFAACYGMLQGGGMMGFLLKLGHNGFFGNEDTFEISGIDIDVWVIAFLAFLVGATISYWLPREAIMKAFLFKLENNQDTPKMSKKESRKARIACLLASCVIASTTAIGFHNTFTSLSGISDDHPSSICLTIIFGLILWASTYWLMLNPMKDVVASLSDTKSFVPQFENYKNKNAVKYLWYGAGISATVAMMGFAFVCMPIFVDGFAHLIEVGDEGTARHVVEGVALFILGCAALCQVPLVLDRTTQYIDRNFEKNENTTASFHNTKELANGSANKLYYAFVLPNAILGAPATYLGMVNALAMLANIDKQGNSSVFSYGDSDAAIIIYTIGIIVFLIATFTSMLINSKPPPDLPNFYTETRNLHSHA